MNIGVLTLSDKGAAGMREDLSGKLLQDLLSTMGKITEYKILPDENTLIVELLTDWCDNKKLDLIVTTGGTGLSPRDRTPEATRSILDIEIPGMAEAMRAESMKITPYAMLSRGVAGMRGDTLIINLPGSPKAVKENIAVLLPVISHAVGKMQGDTQDCAR